MSNSCGFSLSVGQNETHRRFRLRRLFLSFAIACILFGFVMQMDAQEMNFKAVDCGWLAGINDAGVAIGNGDPGGFLYKDGKCTPAAIGGRLLAIANNGDILSTDGTDYFITGADGTRKIGLTVPLPVSDGSTRIGFITKITGINSAGQIVGNFGSGDATYSIYGIPNLSEPGSATAPPPSDHFTVAVCDDNGKIQRTMANAINDAGQIVGTCGFRGFLLQGGAFTYFSGPDGSTFTNPTAISSTGVVVGGYQPTKSAQQDAFIYTGGGSIKPLNPLGMPQSTALGVNSSSVIVGSYQKIFRQGPEKGFISGSFSQPSKTSYLTVYLGGAGGDAPYIPDQVKSLQEAGFQNAYAGNVSGGMASNLSEIPLLTKRRKVDRLGVEIPWSLHFMLSLSDDGKPLNFIGYSYGSLIAAQCAAYYADAGRKIGMVALVGSPISQEFLEELRHNKKIEQVVVVDLRRYGDQIYAGMPLFDVVNPLTIEAIALQYPASQSGLGHFYYTPDNATGRLRRRELAATLRDEQPK